MLTFISSTSSHWRGKLLLISNYHDDHHHQHYQHQQQRRRRQHNSDDTPQHVNGTTIAKQADVDLTMGADPRTRQTTCPGVICMFFFLRFICFYVILLTTFTFDRYDMSTAQRQHMESTSTRRWVLTPRTRQTTCPGVIGMFFFLSFAFILLLLTTLLGTN